MSEYNFHIIKQWTAWAIKFHDKWRGEDGPARHSADDAGKWPYETFANGFSKAEGASVVSIDDIEDAMEQTDANFGRIAEKRGAAGLTRLVWRERPFLEFCPPWGNYKATWMIYMRFAWLPGENKR